MGCVLQQLSYQSQNQQHVSATPWAQVQESQFLQSWTRTQSFKETKRTVQDRQVHCGIVDPGRHSSAQWCVIN